MSRSITDYFNHIRDELIFLKEDSVKYSFDLFRNDKKTVLSYTRSLEIIGEACKNIPVAYKSKYPQIDWKGFAGLRDIIIHQYFGIDYEAIWDTIVNEIPEMLLEIERIIQLESK